MNYFAVKDARARGVFAVEQAAGITCLYVMNAC